MVGVVSSHIRQLFILLETLKPFPQFCTKYQKCKICVIQEKLNFCGKSDRHPIKLYYIADFMLSNRVNLQTSESVFSMFSFTLQVSFSKIRTAPDNRTEHTRLIRDGCVRTILDLGQENKSGGYCISE